MAIEKDVLISISEASHILGVTEVTLRQWTNEGDIKAFVTPGGHRRYSKEELKKLIRMHHKILGVNDLASRLGDSVPLHREIAANFMQSTVLFSKLDIEAQKQLSVLGRQLLSLIAKYITEPANQKETLSSIKEIGQKFGDITARLGVPLIDAIQAFTQHRQPIINMTSEMLQKGESLSRRLIETIPMVNHVMDEALVSLVSAHQQANQSVSQLDTD